MESASRQQVQVSTLVVDRRDGTSHYLKILVEKSIVGLRRNLLDGLSPYPTTRLGILMVHLKPVSVGGKARYQITLSKKELGH